MLSEKIKNFLNHQKLGYVATVNSQNKPNVSPKGTIIVWDTVHLAFANIRSPDTIKNLQENHAIEISSIDPLLRKGYLFSGHAEVLRTGTVYEQILNYYRTNGVQSPIDSIVLVTVETVNEVFSPLYDLGATESQLKTKWKKHYLDL